MGRRLRSLSHMRDPERPPAGKGPEHQVETEPPKGVAEGNSGQVSQVWAGAPAALETPLEIGGTVSPKAALSAKGEQTAERRGAQGASRGGTAPAPRCPPAAMGSGSQLRFRRKSPACCLRVHAGTSTAPVPPRGPAQPP